MSDADQVQPTPPAVPPNQGQPVWPVYPPAPGYPPPQPAAPMYPPQPGYPAYPQGGYYGYPAYPPAPAGQYPYPAYPYPYPAYGYPPAVAPRPPRDTYRLVVGIIATFLLSVTILAGLLMVLALAIGAFANIPGLGDNLGALALITFVAIFATGGGGVGLYFTIRALLGRPSAVARPPTYVVPLALTVVTLGVGVALHVAGVPQGTALAETPFLLLSGILPAVTIFAFTAQRLGYPTTWRRAWLAFLSGTFLATLLALILELVASSVLVLLLRADGAGVDQLNSGSARDIVALLLVVSVVAPIAEEGFKPIGPLIIIGRLRGPAEAFLLGMASGLGFDIFETTGYISQGQADWIAIAVERLGSGLLHGVGAGMATLGWYYLVRGGDMPQRYRKGIGAIAYAVVQHGVFNGSNFLALLPGPLGDWLNAPVWFFGIPETGTIYLLFALYAVILVVLFRITRYLHSGGSLPDAAPNSPGTLLPAGGSQA